MPWVKIDERLPDHPKVMNISDKAFRLYITSICYSSANRTDGEILPNALPRIGGTPKLAQELVRAVLWDTTNRGGWVVHDYLKYNRSKIQMEAVSQTRRESGSKGLAKRYENAWQPASNLPLSASGSGSHDSLNPARVIQVLPEPERPNASKLLSPDELDSLYRRICDAWVNCTGGTIARVPVERLVAYVERTSEQWVFDAITTTGEQGKRSPSYTYAILENWIQGGREVEPSASDPTSKFRDNPLVKAATAWKEANG